MSEELKRYNHLNYRKSSKTKEDDGFLDFLYSNSELTYPKVSELQAWDKLAQKISENKSRKQSAWLKIAASITILISVALSFYYVDLNPDQIQVASGQEKKTVTFPDGSTGILNTQSKFSYPEKFGFERNVSFSGEAYFDIKKSKKPFIINANGVDVKVLGTAFNLVTSESQVKLYVDRGLVAFLKNGYETKISAGKEAIFNRITNEIIIKKAPSSNIMSWRNGSFIFDNTPLAEVIKELSAYYQVNFKLSSDQLQNCRITASINGKPLKEVLDLIESILDVNTKLKDNTVKISGKGC